MTVKVVVRHAVRGTSRRAQMNPKVVQFVTTPPAKQTLTSSSFDFKFYLLLPSVLVIPAYHTSHFSLGLPVAAFERHQQAVSPKVRSNSVCVHQVTVLKGLVQLSHLPSRGRRWGSRSPQHSQPSPPGYRSCFGLGLRLSLSFSFCSAFALPAALALAFGGIT